MEVIQTMGASSNAYLSYPKGAICYTPANVFLNRSNSGILRYYEFRY